MSMKGKLILLAILISTSILLLLIFGDKDAESIKARIKNSKTSSLGELLKKSQNQDSEFPQGMDLMNEPNSNRDNPLKSEKSTMHREKEDTLLKVDDDPISFDGDNPGPDSGLDSGSGTINDNGSDPIGGNEFLQENYDGSIGIRHGKFKDLKDYEDLVFCTIIPNFDSKVFLELLRAFVGGIHQLRQGRHKVPRIELFTLVLPSSIPNRVIEETSWWSNVKISNIQNFLGLPVTDNTSLAVNKHQLRLVILDRLVKEYGNAIWIKFGYVVEPQRIPIYRAEQAESAPELIEAYKSGRKEMMNLANDMNDKGYIISKQGKALTFSNKLMMTGRKNSTEQNILRGLYVVGEDVIEGYSLKKGLKLISDQLSCLLTPKECILPKLESEMDAADYGIFPSDPSSQIGCTIDVSEESIQSTILVKEIGATSLTGAYTKLLTESTLDKKIRKVAIAFPTTSKGLKAGSEVVFVEHLIPSLINTITIEEYNNTLITIYIGYDHGDPIFEDEKFRTLLFKSLTKLIGNRPINVKLIRLPNTHRVALLWNLLYLHSLKEGNNYFYQVNDDLNMVTPGWLTYFTNTLDSNGGFGVVGPADFHNGLNCSILTQSMVTPVHFDIFGMLYPIELRDWKSDRWLTYVYQPNDTHCRQDVIANNGGAPTRYQHCEFRSYVIYLEAGRRRIAQWKASKLERSFL